MASRSRDEEDIDQGYDYDEESSDQQESDLEDHGQEATKKMQKLKRSLAHVSFEQLADLNHKMDQEAASHDTTKRPNKTQILKDLTAASKKLRGIRQPKTKDDMKRASKHSPMEMSSKKAVSRLRNVVESTSVKRRDPRFDKLSGKLNQDLFEKTYDFVNDYKKEEQEQLKKRLAKTKDLDQKAEIKAELTKMKSQEKAALDKKRKQDLARERKKAEADLVKQGKTPYFLKRSEKRKLELMDKYSQLGEKSVDRILEKRRKKNANKDHRHLPFKRRSN
ncbi:DUF947-domain-containing protein [Hesseltinella vesiculosa]|uniref:rRNA biogenesis protein RRP36 n=1 Tax=Hesseltinella vesiculosa TaxID=101127 RepID=A0A1X2GN86_9FUNG|nr:DUF947-domain-containing protein [Hesseltinella vesiculosa]